MTRATTWMGLLTLPVLLSCDHDCNIHNCADGCCGAHGVCYVGQSTSHCGVRAEPCVDCSFTLGACNNGVCSAPCTSGSCGTGCCGSDGSCHPAGQCGSSCGLSCFGCCGTDGLCHTGNQAANCGHSGQACVNCASLGQYCDTDHCVQCNISTCPTGCCDSSGACQTTAFDFQCGPNGQACRDCSTTGLKCTQSHTCGSCNDINVSCTSTFDCCAGYTCSQTTGTCG